MLFKSLIIQLTCLSIVWAFSGYTSDPNIYDLTPLTFDKVVHKSNYTSIVQFYAPWCGYCQKLAPVYQKLGKLIQKDANYAINVVAVNCDRDINKEMCSRYQITGFPTVKVFRPQKFVYGSTEKIHKAASDTYRGERLLKPMWKHLEGQIKNYVKKFPSLGEALTNWVLESTPNDPRRRAVVISNSRNLSVMIKLLGIDFLNSWRFAVGVVGKDTTTIDFEINGHKVPFKDGDSLPMLLAWKEDLGWVKYTGKTNDYKAVSKWLAKESGIQPSEGPLLKKEKKYYSKYRTGKLNMEHDEL